MFTHEALLTFDSRVNLVSVPVVVRDREGKPVGNLRQEDFQIADKGRMQEVMRVHHRDHSCPAPLAAGAAPGASVVVLNVVPNVVPAVEAAAPGKPVLPQRYVAYLFDDVHMKPGDLLNARKAANQQLDTRLDAGSRAGISPPSARLTMIWTLRESTSQLHVRREETEANPVEQGADKNQDCPYVTYHLADILVNQEHSMSPGDSDEQIIGYINSWRFPGLSAVFSEAAVCMHMDPPQPGSAIATTVLQQMIGPLRNATQLALSRGDEETKSSLNLMKDLVRTVSSMPGSRTIVMVSPGFLLLPEHRLYGK